MKENIRLSILSGGLSPSLVRSKALLGGMLVALAGNALAGEEKCDLDVLKHVRSNSAVHVIATFKKTPSKEEVSRLERAGFSVYRHLDFIHSLAGVASPLAIRVMESTPAIIGLSSDEKVRKTDAFTVASSLANAAATTFKLTGAGVGVAVLDSGVSEIPDFGGTGSNGKKQGGGTSSRLLTQVDFTGLGVDDQCGHGTHVGGIIGGDGTSSTGKHYFQTITGVAPGASLVSVRVLDAQGSGTVSNVISGVQWCIANASKYNIRILNMSLGHPVSESYTTDPLCKAVEAAWKSGIVVVCAAGNGGRLHPSLKAGDPNGGYGTAYASVESPGNDPYVITVGAMKSIDGKRSNDQIATYSGRGPSLNDFVMKPDLVAPGNQIISTQDPGKSYLVSTYGAQVEIPLRSFQSNGNPHGFSSTYFKLSGTSMAAPVVAGAAALMLQQQPNLTPDTVKARLMISADKWTDPGGNADPCTYGAGYLNVERALVSGVRATTHALSPSLSQDAYGNVFVQYDPSIFGQRAMWGTGIWNLQAIYGQRAMWGTFFNNLSSSRAMWGTGFWSQIGASSTAKGGIDCTSSSVLVSGE